MKDALLEEATREALALPRGEQEVLAEKLVGNVLAHVPAAVKRRQVVEVMRRREEVLSSKITGLSAKQVLREIQTLVATNAHESPRIR